MAVVGFLIIMALAYRNVPGAVSIGILTVALVGLLTGNIEFGGIGRTAIVAPTLMQLDIAGAFDISMIR